MIFGIRGAKPKNPLDSEVLGTFNFTDYGLSYATAAELEALRVSFNMSVFKIEADQPQSQSCRVTMRIRSQQINCLVTFSLRRIKHEESAPPKKKVLGSFCRFACSMNHCQKNIVLWQNTFYGVRDSQLGLLSCQGERQE